MFDSGSVLRRHRRSFWPLDPGRDLTPSQRRTPDGQLTFDGQIRVANAIEAPWQLQLGRAELRAVQTTLCTPFSVLCNRCVAVDHDC
ncbi:hypothetical protein PI125_g7707 [Phytophthora idaei]|nr:hypothetical protein PI125_g7707 [Phytophthora idaei]